MASGVGGDMVRTVAEFMAQTGEDAPTEAERRLVEAVRAGRICRLGTSVPDEPSDADRVRAWLLRLLINDATADSGARERGVWVKGGWIAGELDLTYVQARGAVVMDSCRFERRLMLLSARMTMLSLQESVLPGFFAARMEVKENVFLRKVRSKNTLSMSGAKVGGQLIFAGATIEGDKGVAVKAQGVTTGQDLVLNSMTAKGTVDLMSMRVGGQLACIGATLNGAGGYALSAQGIETGKDLCLRRVTATGPVIMSGARVAGQLTFDGATLDGAGGKALNAQNLVTVQSLHLTGVKATGTITLAGARVGGQLVFADSVLDGVKEWALATQGLDVNLGLVWRKMVVRRGAVGLSSTTVGYLADDGNWPTGETALILDGFSYARISGNAAPVSAMGRREWLMSGSRWDGRFLPQPYTQLAKVLREMGHAGEARTVLCWREEALWQQACRDIADAPLVDEDVAFGTVWRGLRVWLYRGWARALGLVAGYGFKPQRGVFALLVLWALAWVTAMAVWREGSFAPNSDVILTSDGWQAALAADCFPVAVAGCDPNPAMTWANDPARGMDWDTFAAGAYALDLVMPVLDIGQTEAWAPSKDRGRAGRTLWWGRWVFQGAGWFVVLVLAAALTGIMQRDKE